MLKILALAATILLAATVVRSEETPFGEKGASTLGIAREFDRLVNLLGDDVLRDMVCRLSSEHYTPARLSSALGLPEGQVLRRINALRGWGLVRLVRRDSLTSIVEPLPGAGMHTLRRWADKYCFPGNSCGAGNYKPSKNLKAREVGMANLHDVRWDELPVPEDDGGADHLIGLRLPNNRLMSTSGTEIDLSALVGRSVVYAYPLTGRPDKPLPDGWDMIPGARGCTPQSCSFRDHADELRKLGVTHIFGLSTQDTEYQREAVERLHLPFELLSDADLLLAREMNLPTFEVDGKILLKRLTMVIDEGQIAHYFYPVFPPDRARDLVDWLSREGR